jgi:hypothetical protein
MWFYARESLVSRKPVFFSLSVIFASQSEAKKAGTLFFRQIDSQEDNVGSADRLNS